VPVQRRASQGDARSDRSSTLRRAIFARPACPAPRIGRFTTASLQRPCPARREL